MTVDRPEHSVVELTEDAANGLSLKSAFHDDAFKDSNGEYFGKL